MIAFVILRVKSSFETTCLSIRGCDFLLVCVCVRAWTVSLQHPGFLKRPVQWLNLAATFKILTTHTHAHKYKKKSLQVYAKFLNEILPE